MPTHLKLVNKVPGLNSENKELNQSFGEKWLWKDIFFFLRPQTLYGMCQQLLTLLAGKEYTRNPLYFESATVSEHLAEGLKLVFSGNGDLAGDPWVHPKSAHVTHFVQGIQKIRKNCSDEWKSTYQGIIATVSGEKVILPKLNRESREGHGIL